MSISKMNFNTWHQIPIQVEKTQEKIIITTYNLPWFIELVLWYSPFVVLCYFLLYTTFNYFVGLILILLFILFGLDKRQFYPIQSWLMTPFTMVHRVFGIRHKLSFILNTTGKNNLHLNKNEYLFSDVFGLGFYGYNLMYIALNTYFLQIAQIVILLKDELIIPIGGFYGFFFTQKSRPKQEFEYFYSYLSNIFQLKDITFHELKSTPFNTTICSWRSNKWTANVEKKTGKKKTFRFQRKLEEFRTIGFFESNFIVLMLFMMGCIYAIGNIISFLFNIDSSIIVYSFLFAFIIKSIYLGYWLVYLAFTVKLGEPKHYFKFEENVS